MSKEASVVDVKEKTAPSTTKAAAKDAPEKEPAVSFLTLIREADVFDCIFMLVGGVAAGGTGALQPCFILIFGDVVNQLKPPVIDPATYDPSAPVSIAMPSFEQAVHSSVIWFLILGAVAFGCGYLQVACWEATSQRQSNRIRRKYLRSLTRQEIAFFDEKDSGALLARVVSDTNAIQEALSSKLGVCLQHLGAALAGIIIGFVKGWRMSLVCVSVLPLLGVGGALYGLTMTQGQKQQQAAYAQASALAKETLGSIRVVAAFGGEERFLARFAEACLPAQRSEARAAMIGGINTGFFLLVMFGSYPLALWYGSTRIEAGEYTGGQVMIVLFAVMMGGLELGSAVPGFSTILAGRVGAHHAFQIIDRVPTIDQGGDAGLKLATVEGHIEFKNVTFAYPSRPNAPVLTAFNLTVPAGTSMALVGHSGCGKSTIVQLLQRYYDPIGGGVFLDGSDLRQLNLRWARQQMGLVSQEPSLFATTIGRNIRYGKVGEEVSQEQVEAAARAANVHEFISKLPQGYDTQVGERGVQLSGGQKQRIAIARAVLRNPTVLLLDEATSALDSESERLVQSALDRLMRGRTSVIIAHRLSTIRDADCISVLDRGRVVEQGRHVQLAEVEGGAYFQLLNKRRGSQVVGDLQGGARKEADGTGNHLSGLLLAGSGAGLSAGNLGSASPKGGDDDGSGARSSLPGAADQAGCSGADAAAAAAVANGGVPLAAAAAADAAAGVDAAAKIPSCCGKRGGGKKAKGEAPPPAEPEVKIPYKRLLTLCNERSALLPVGVMSSAVVGGIMPCFALALASIIEAFLLPVDEMRRRVRMWCLIFMAIAVGSFIFAVVQMWSLGALGALVSRNARRLAFAAVLRMEIAYFDQEEHSSGRLTATLEEDATYIRGAISDQVSVACQNLVVMAAGFIISFSYSWKLSLIILSTLPALIAAATVQMSMVSGVGSETEKLYGHTKQLLADALGNMRAVLAFGLEDEMIRLYAEAQEGPRTYQIRKAQTQGVGFGCGQAIFMLLYALAFWQGSRLVDKGEIAPGSIFKCFFAIVFLGMGFGIVSVAFPNIGKASGAVKNIFGIVDRISKIDPADPGGEIPETCIGAVDFESVEFHYPSRPAVKVMRGLTLAVPPERTTALVGPSGGGKSTVIALLQRFYDPTAGSVKFDGRDLRSLNLRWLRRRLGMVLQEPTLFSTSIYENILYGREDAEKAWRRLLEAVVDEVEAAAKAANASEFIEQLPEKYEAQVGERGVQMSGGQKQRIAIARAVLRNPTVLLLDEATSALDSESERLVQAALDRLMKGRTSIVIAHRLSTIRDADQIAVISNGVVRELGTHDALLATPGSTYAELHRMQNADGGGDAADHHNGVVAAPGGGGGGAALAHLASVDES